MSFEPTPKLPPFPERSVDVEAGWQRYEPLVSPQDLKEQFLFGIPLKSSLNNEELSDKTLKSFITRAVSYAEHKIKIPISPVKFQDRYDYNLWDYQKYNYLQLNHWPVIQIESVKGKYPNAVDFITFPMEWISLYNETGVFQLTPTNGQITQFFLTNDATYIPLLLGSRAQWPQLWQITYVAGFELDKIPAIVNEYIGLVASIKIMELLTSVIFPYGSYGIGIDGTSQSVSTPGPALLENRIAQANERAMDLMDTIKRYYNRQLLLTAI